MHEWPVPAALLREEVRAMHDAVLSRVYERIPRSRLRGVYFKGSASKPWLDPIDYVPELSDLDLHFWLTDDADRRLLTEGGAALDFMRDVNDAYSCAQPAARHWPRLQLTFLNDLLELPRFAGAHVIVVHGEPYPGGRPEAEHDRQAILEQSAAAETIGGDLFDKVGPHQFAALRALSWRVTPTAPRLLHALGCPADIAWHEPRSVLLEHLTKFGHAEFARLYRAYYRSAWRAFEHGWRDGRSLHETLTLGFEVLRTARTIAQSIGERERRGT